jgi:hypothetical protein
MCLDAQAWEALLGSERVSAASKRTLKDSAAAPGGFAARFKLKNAADVRAFAQLVIQRHRMPAGK